MYTAIDCPACNSCKIQINILKLMEGNSFKCNNCNALISISNDSLPVLNETFKKFKSFKKTLELGEKNDQV